MYVYLLLLLVIVYLLMFSFDFFLLLAVNCLHCLFYKHENQINTISDMRARMVYSKILICMVKLRQKPHGMAIKIKIIYRACVVALSISWQIFWSGPLVAMRVCVCDVAFNDAFAIWYLYFFLLFRCDVWAILNISIYMTCVCIVVSYAFTCLEHFILYTIQLMCTVFFIISLVYNIYLYVYKLVGETFSDLIMIFYFIFSTEYYRRLSSRSH